VFLFISLFLLFLSISYSTKKGVKYAKSRVGLSPLNHGSVLAGRGQESGFSSKEHISIYNIKGHKIKTYTFTSGSCRIGTSVNPTSSLTPQPTNRYSVTRNGTDDHNQHVSSGVHFYKMKTGYQENQRNYSIKIK
jgi:hypothetical protein